MMFADSQWLSNQASTASCISTVVASLTFKITNIFDFINSVFHLNLLPQYLRWDLFLFIWEFYSIISWAWTTCFHFFYTHNAFQMAFKIGQATHTTKICTSLQWLSKVDLKNQLGCFTILEKSPLCSWNSTIYNDPYCWQSWIIM